MNINIKKSKNAVIINVSSLISLTIILGLLLLSNIPKALLLPLCFGLILALFYLLYILISQKSLYIRKDNFIAFNAINGSFLFNVEKIHSVKVYQNFWGKMFDIYILNIEEDNAQITTLYYTSNILKNPDFLENTLFNTQSLDRKIKSHSGQQ